MATGVAPVPLTHVRVRDGGFGFTRTVDFAKVMSAPGTGAVRTSSSRGRAPVAKSSSTGSDTMELEPSSEGSPLLGMSRLHSRLYVYFMSRGLQFAQIQFMIV
jgi:(E)-4-hydroxy-3-methylbut-2-enyl-diphosphate synthase